MKELKEITNNITMTSLEIAELTGKRHDHVTRDIEEQLGKLPEISLPKFGDTYINERGREYKMYRLPKREVLILISGYSVELRAKIIDRLEELENKLKQQIPANYIEALELALEQAKKIEALSNKIEEDKPKVAFANAVTESNHCITITELSRYLQANGVNIGRNKLYEYLRKNNYLISGGRDKNLPTQKYMEMGLFRVVESTVNHNDYQLVTNQTLVTGKGQEYFLNKLYANG